MAQYIHPGRFVEDQPRVVIVEDGGPERKAGTVRLGMGQAQHVCLLLAEHIKSFDPVGWKEILKRIDG